MFLNRILQRCTTFAHLLAATVTLVALVGAVRLSERVRGTVVAAPSAHALSQIATGCPTIAFNLACDPAQQWAVCDPLASPPCASTVTKELPACQLDCDLYGYTVTVESCGPIVGGTVLVNHSDGSISGGNLVASSCENIWFYTACLYDADVPPGGAHSGGVPTHITVQTQGNTMSSVLIKSIKVNRHCCSMFSCS